MVALTERQRQIASILPRVTALMSWLGSLSITIDVVRKYRKRGASNPKPMTYHGLMLGMSLFDMACSGGHVMTTWPIPAGTPGAYDARGTEASCQAQAFFIQLGIGAIFYNLCLSVYYYLFIVKNIRTSSRLEKCMHFVCFSAAFGTAVAGLALDLFGYALNWCWITAEHNLFRWCFWYGPLWVVIFIVALLMSMIYIKLKKQENLQRRWRWKIPTRPSPRRGSAGETPAQPPANNANEEVTSNNQGSIAANSNVGGSNNIRHGNNGNRSPQTTRASDNVKWQAFRYVGSFFLSWFFLTVARAMQAAGKSDATPAWIILAGVILVPSQGFFNFLIYIRPRYKEQRKKHPEAGRLATFFRVHPLLAGCKCCRGARWIVETVNSRGRNVTLEEPSNNVASPNTLAGASIHATARECDSRVEHDVEQNGEKAGWDTASF